MNKIKHWFQLMGLAILVLSCSPFRVVSDYDKNTDFSQYKTYKIDLGELKLNDIDESRVVSELKNQLALKNILPADNPDLVIKVKASHKLVRNNYITPSIGIGNWGHWFNWGFGLSRTISSEQNKGTLVFDFIDAKTGKMVWQGVGSGISVDSPKSKQEQIPSIISEMLKDFPPKRK
ncbi:MAG: DUF4136 domain-containing protein [Flavobacteriaceae bacterium]|nr:DUF4136 domain-containing protein [Flavobacteriaceae bacterium]